MPLQGCGRARHPAELQAHVPAGRSTHHPAGDTRPPRAAGVLWRYEGDQCWGTAAPLPPQSCSALCSDVVDKADGSYSRIGLCEAECLISSPAPTAVTPEVVACRVWKFLVLEMSAWVWSPGISSGSVFPFVKNAS